MRRRDFLRDTLLGLGALTLPGCAPASETTPPSSSIDTSSNIRVGTGPDSWGVWFADDPKQIPWQRYLDEVVEAGYEWTELGPYGYMPTDPVSLGKELESRQLKLAGGFVINHLEDPSLFSQLQEQATEVGELVSALGAKFLVLIDATYTNMSGDQTLPIRLESDGWKQLLETTQKLAESISERFGLRLVFHPHADSHVQYAEQVEEFLDQTDPIVSLCLDTGHYAYRGGDPVDLVRRRHERIHYLHLKTVREEVRSRVEAEGIPFVRAVGMDMFCELPEGVIDFVALKDALGEVDYHGYAIVEQDMYPAPFDKPLPIAKRTRRYLSDIGFG